MAIRVNVDIVPWGREDLVESIGTLLIYRSHDDKKVSKVPASLSDFYHYYDVILEVKEGNKTETTKVGTFKLHRYGWYRNRLGLAARGLKMLQSYRDKGKHLPAEPPFHKSTDFVRNENA